MADNAPRPARTVHGLSVGILMLETGFERILGDIGNAGSFSFPVQYKVVKGASVQRVYEAQDPSLLDDFVAAAEDLIGLGIGAISTSCGALALFQRELAARLPVPVATTSMLQVPLVARMLKANQRVAIATYAAEALTPAHLKAVGVDPATPIVGLEPGGAFRQAISGGARTLPVEAMRADFLATIERFLAEHADIGALVFECGNMSPYSHDVSRRFGLPVFDIVGMIELLHAGLHPRRF